MIIAKKNENKLTEIFDRALELIIPKDKDISELLPYKKILKNEVLVTNDDRFQIFFRVKTTDLTSISEDGFIRMVNKLTYLNRVYLEPYKIYSLTYPTETIEQGIFWKNRIQEAKRELFNNREPYLDKYLKWNLKLAYDNYERVDLVSTLPELMFVIAVYGNTLKEVKNHADIMKQAGGKELGLKILKDEELVNVIAKLMNPNSSL
ncbi:MULTISPECIES: hypothetical protein [Bacillota]|uniref:hypothetical protein n=1 Tax=Bacillota TaxID=1239 RepID=UPI00064125A5|nr:MULTISPECIES: hypothetical protein [Bacillota]KLN95150.1 hypothetical protein ABT60_01085 [Enterococcus cecorum]MDZ5560711.1 hypothetical protein [Enterococcus cecorum]PWX10532.1 hypothetical protein CYK69_14535 [Clostridium perfringens]PWX58352.1 hypothetical protein CYK88_09520 [Clostridium perfringens]